MRKKQGDFKNQSKTKRNTLLWKKLQERDACLLGLAVPRDHLQLLVPLMLRNKHPVWFRWVPHPAVKQIPRIGPWCLTSHKTSPTNQSLHLGSLKQLKGENLRERGSLRDRGTLRDIPACDEHTKNEGKDRENGNPWCRDFGRGASLHVVVWGRIRKFGVWKGKYAGNDECEGRNGLKRRDRGRKLQRRYVYLWEKRG